MKSSVNRAFDQALADNIAQHIATSGTDCDWVIEFVKSNLSPDDVFDESDLNYWALDNGFIKDDTE